MVKVSTTLKVLAYMQKGFSLVDQSGENPQTITKPQIMSGSEDGIASDVEIKGTISLSTEQIAELVHQGNAGRELVVLVKLED